MANKKRSTWIDPRTGMRFTRVGKVSRWLSRGRVQGRPVALKWTVWMWFGEVVRALLRCDLPYLIRLSILLTTVIVLVAIPVAMAEVVLSAIDPAILGGAK